MVKDGKVVANPSPQWSEIRADLPEQEILARLPQHIGQLHAMALRTYKAWTDQLDRPVSVSCNSLSETVSRFRLKSNEYLHMQR